MDFCKRTIKAGGNDFDLRKQPLKFFACCYAVATRQMPQKVEIEEAEKVFALSASWVIPMTSLQCPFQRGFRGEP